MGLPIEPLVQYIEKIYPDCHRSSTGNDRWHDRVSDMIAELSGLTRRTVTRIICRETKSARVDTIDRICISLGVHPAEIYGRLWTHKWCPRCGMLLPLYRFSMEGKSIKRHCHSCELKKEKERRERKRGMR